MHFTEGSTELQEYGGKFIDWVRIANGAWNSMAAETYENKRERERARERNVRTECEWKSHENKRSHDVSGRAICSVNWKLNDEQESAVHSSYSLYRGNITNSDIQCIPVWSVISVHIRTIAPLNGFAFCWIRVLISSSQVKVSNYCCVMREQCSRNMSQRELRVEYGVGYINWKDTCPNQLLDLKSKEKSAQQCRAHGIDLNIFWMAVTLRCCQWSRNTIQIM